VNAKAFSLAGTKAEADRKRPRLETIVRAEEEIFMVN